MLTVASRRTTVVIALAHPSLVLDAYNLESVLQTCSSWITLVLMLAACLSPCANACHLVLHVCVHACHLVPVLQTNNIRSSWDAVWMAPEEIAKEGIIISPHLLDDHYTITLEVPCITL